MIINDQILKQVDEIYQEFQSLRGRSAEDDVSDLPEGEIVRFNTRARSLIHRITGDSSPYVKQCEEIISHGGYAGYQARQLIGVVDSLRADVAAGYLETQKELIHGEMFADFLEMAYHLLDEGYKDAAAVIAGSSLEAHLRQLALKASIYTEVKGERRDVLIPIKADRLNADLTNAGVYSKLDSKNITAWLDLRNKAAHGHYDQYEKPQVSIMISGVRDFISRKPA